MGTYFFLRNPRGAPSSPEGPELHHPGGHPHYPERSTPPGSSFATYELAAGFDVGLHPLDAPSEIPLDAAEEHSSVPWRVPSTP